MPLRAGNTNFTSKIILNVGRIYLIQIREGKQCKLKFGLLVLQILQPRMSFPAIFIILRVGLFLTETSKIQYYLPFIIYFRKLLCINPCSLIKCVLEYVKDKYIKYSIIAKISGWIISIICFHHMQCMHNSSVGYIHTYTMKHLTWNGCKESHTRSSGYSHLHYQIISTKCYISTTITVHKLKPY